MKFSDIRFVIGFVIWLMLIDISLGYAASIEDFSVCYTMTVTNDNSNKNISKNAVLELTINHTFFINNGSLDNGDDIRIFYNNTEIDRKSNKWNNSAAIIYFYNQNNITSQNKDSNYLFCYKNNTILSSPLINVNESNTIFSDDFNGLIHNWNSTTNSKVNLKNNRLELGRTGGSWQGAYYNFSNYSVIHEYEIETDIFFHTSSSYGGLLMNWETTTPISEFSYGVRVDWTNTGGVRMYRFNNVLMASNSSITPYNTTVKLRRAGNTYEFYINNVKTLSASDCCINGSSFAGLMTGNTITNNMSYDNLKINIPPYYERQNTTITLSIPIIINLSFPGDNSVNTSVFATPIMFFGYIPYNSYYPPLNATLFVDGVGVRSNLSIITINSTNTLNYEFYSTSIHNWLVNICVESGLCYNSSEYKVNILKTTNTLSEQPSAQENLKTEKNVGEILKYGLTILLVVLVMAIFWEFLLRV